MRTRQAKNNFTAGEIRPDLLGSVNLAVHQNGMRRALNGQVRDTGGISKRSGWSYIAPVHDQAERSKLLVFQRSSEDVRIIELIAGRGVVYRAGDRQRLNPDAEFDFEHTLPEDMLAYIRTVQNGDALILFDMRTLRPMSVITRRADDDWIFGRWRVEEGPWRDRIETARLSMAGRTGRIRIDSTQDVFEAGHVGALLRLYQSSASAPYNAWQADKRLNNKERGRVYNNGRVYRYVGVDPINAPNNEVVTGLNPPSHTEGEQTDGRLIWEFVDDGAGVVEIVEVETPRTILADVKIALPDMLATSYWEFGGFCEKFGYPSGGLLHQERVFLYGARDRPDEIYASAVRGYGADYANFKPGLGTGLVVDSDAMRRRASGGSSHPVNWMVVGGDIIVGTTAGEHRLGGPTQYEGMSPAETTIRERGKKGSAGLVEPAVTEAYVMFAARGAREVRALDVSLQGLSQSVSKQASHLFTSPIRQLAYVDQPDDLLYVRLDDGQILLGAFDPENEIRAFCPMQIGGKGVVEDVIAVPGGAARFDACWAIIAREVDGKTVRTIEVHERLWRGEWDRRGEAILVDGAAYLDRWNADPGAKIRIVAPADFGDQVKVERYGDALVGVEVGDIVIVSDDDPLGVMPRRRYQFKIVDDGDVLTVEALSDLKAMTTQYWARAPQQLSGLHWLEGFEVDIVVDGIAAERQTVSGGSIDVSSAPGGAYVVGLPYRYIGEPILPDIPVSEGAGTGSQAQLHSPTLRLHEALGGYVFDPTREEDGYPLSLRDIDEPMGRGPPLQSGVVAAEIDAGASRDPRLAWSSDQPYPFTVIALYHGVEANA